MRNKKLSRKLNCKLIFGFIRMLILIPAVLGGFSCKTAEFGCQTIDVNGMIYDFDNRPVPHCEVTIGSKYCGITDINGRFSLPKIPEGTYVITGIKNGFETYTEEITISGWGQIIYIRMPSQAQLLELADQALTNLDYAAACENAEKAYLIDNKSTEAVFYYAIVKYRQGESQKALEILEKASADGIRDIYIDKFIKTIKEARSENTSE